MRCGRAAILVLAACACGTDIHDLARTKGPVVATYRAPAPAGLSTFAVVSRVGRVTSDPNVFETSADAPALVAKVTAALEARGLTKAADVDPASPPPSPPADLAVNVTALEGDRTAFGTWEAAPGHLQPAGFGLPGLGWTYPWAWGPLATGGTALVVEIADLRDAPAPGGGVQVLWAAFCPDAFPVGGPYDGAGVLAALDQALAQRPPLAAEIAP
jgi:hypothetical protein